MNSKFWMPLVLLGLCLAAFLGYSLWDAANTDTTPPVLSFSDQLLQLSTQEPKSSLLQGVTATDDWDGDVTAGIVVEKIFLNNDDGLATVTYAAFDQAGNVAKASRQIQYTDYRGPRFTLKSAMLFGQTGADVLRYIGAEDPLDGNISHRVRATLLDEESLSTPGIHPLQLQVTNSLGHTQTLVIPVEIRRNDNYQAQLTLTEYLIYMKQGGKFRAENYLSTFTLGNTPLTLSGSVPQGFTLQTTGTVNTGEPGVYTVTYELTQNENGRSYTAVSKLIVVVEE